MTMITMMITPPMTTGQSRWPTARNISLPTPGQEEIVVDVPAGVETGTRIRLTGQGSVGMGGGPSGWAAEDGHVDCQDPAGIHLGAWPADLKPEAFRMSVAHAACAAPSLRRSQTSPRQ